MVAAMLCCMARAQGPNGSMTYYEDADGKSGKTLKTALGAIINEHTNIGYDGLYEAYKKTDTRADGFVRDWYSNATSYKHGVDNKGNYSKEGDMYNREHSVPQSWFSEKAPMKADIVHVLPTDGYVNNRRSNYPFGEVSTVTYSSKNNYCKLGSCKTEGYSGTVFEPNDEIKGDMARIYFYMATCYQSQCGNWSGNIFTSDGLVKWTMDMMMAWSKQDPVDDVEIARNNAVYEVQNNRNPFVDYPGLEDYIWGDDTDKVFSYDNYTAGEDAKVAKPTFSPEEGSYVNSVEVTLSCNTEGAKIYYTTNGGDASEQSILYEGPFTLTETSTITAIAVLDGERSAQTTATYTITDEQQPGGGDNPGGSGEPAVDGELALNNALFGTNYNGAINANDTEDLTGTLNGITVVYSLARGSNRFCNDSQVRLYPGNTLTFSVASGNITELEIIYASDTQNTSLIANGQAMTDGKWTGSSQEVVVEFGGSSKHARITGAKVKVSGTTTGIDVVQTPQSGQRIIYNLRGQRVTNPTRGLYIVNGKVVVIK